VTARHEFFGQTKRRECVTLFNVSEYNDGSHWLLLKAPTRAFLFPFILMLFARLNLVTLEIATASLHAVSQTASAKSKQARLRELEGDSAIPNLDELPGMR
jgi:hypothetical protein